MTLLDEGRLKEAREALTRAVAIFTGLGRWWEAANAENAIAYVLIADGQHRAARPILEEALRSAVELQSVALAIEALAALGAFACKPIPARRRDCSRRPILSPKRAGNGSTRATRFPL